MKKKDPKISRRDPNIYPPGWDYRRTKSIADYYDSQSDEEQLVELEAALNAPDSVLVPIPRALLSDVLKLIEKKKKSA